MIPSVHNLATLLNRFDCAMLTVIDAEGRPRTRPMAPLKAPFNGHLWFHVGTDGQPASEIGRGADVSVAYGAADAGPYVTVYGWAIVLRDPPYVRSVWRAASEGRHLPRTLSTQLICVTARAAEVWDAASTASRRIFAFSNAHPVCEDDGAVTHEAAVAPRLVTSSGISCAQ
ncbi:MAG: pyridoxamine 5'-phosphate oxidase family protein [Burkholderiales bacterium]